MFTLGLLTSPFKGHIWTHSWKAREDSFWPLRMEAEPWAVSLFQSAIEHWGTKLNIPKSTKTPWMAGRALHATKISLIHYLHTTSLHLLSGADNIAISNSTQNHLSYRLYFLAYLRYSDIYVEIRLWRRSIHAGRKQSSWLSGLLFSSQSTVIHEVSVPFSTEICKGVGAPAQRTCPSHSP